jgi:hypothetical protein
MLQAPAKRKEKKRRPKKRNYVNECEAGSRTTISYDTLVANPKTLAKLSEMANVMFRCISN